MKGCVFCKIINGDLPSDKIYEDDSFIVIRDINPVYRTHLLIITKKHISSVNEIEDPDRDIFSTVFLVAKKVAAKEGVEVNGYRLTVNCGKDAGQIVSHFHMHLLAGEPLRNL